MILLLDTSTPVCKLSLIDADFKYAKEWEVGRGLAKGLLGFLRDCLEENGKSFKDITAIGAFIGPGSFTGLRIGLTVLNTIADSENIQIVGASGEDWQSEVLKRIDRGDNDKIVLPFYGGEANITKPRK